MYTDKQFIKKGWFFVLSEGQDGIVIEEENQLIVEGLKSTRIQCKNTAGTSQDANLQWYGPSGNLFSSSSSDPWVCWLVHWWYIYNIYALIYPSWSSSGIDWLIVLCFMPFQQYSSHVMTVCMIKKLMFMRFWSFLGSSAWQTYTLLWNPGKEMI